MDLEKLMNKNNLCNKYFSLLVQRFCGTLAITMPRAKRKFWLKSLLLKLHLHFRSKSYNSEEDKYWELEKLKP